LSNYLHKIKQNKKQFEDAIIQNKNDQIMVEKVYLVANMVKGAKAAKGKVFFQGLHMTYVIFALVYNL
jgi:hypothetical protein